MKAADPRILVVDGCHLACNAHPTGAPVHPTNGLVRHDNCLYCYIPANKQGENGEGTWWATVWERKYHTVLAGPALQSSGHSVSEISCSQPKGSSVGV